MKLNEIYLSIQIIYIELYYKIYRLELNGWCLWAMHTIWSKEHVNMRFSLNKHIVLWKINSSYIPVVCTQQRIYKTMNFRSLFLSHSSFFILILYQKGCHLNPSRKTLNQMYWTFFFDAGTENRWVWNQTSLASRTRDTNSGLFNNSIICIIWIFKL